jgi:hypothetical protein
LHRQDPLILPIPPASATVLASTTKATVWVARTIFSCAAAWVCQCLSQTEAIANLRKEIAAIGARKPSSLVKMIRKTMMLYNLSGIGLKTAGNVIENL